MTVVNSRGHDGRAVARARELAEAGWGPAQIKRFLQVEFGIEPHYNTVREWVNPALAAKRRRWDKDQKARRRAAASKGRLRCNASRPEFILARIDALKGVAVPAPSIAKVISLDFELEISDLVVRRYLRTGEIPTELRATA